MVVHFRYSEPLALLYLLCLVDGCPKVSTNYHTEKRFIPSLISTGMAYSILAGVPPITGIYMAFFPVFIYMLMGTSRHLSMGTFSIICMMTAKSVLQYADPKYLNLGDSTSTGFRNSSVVTNSSDVLIQAATGTGLTPVQVASAVCMIVGMWHVSSAVFRQVHNCTRAQEC